MRKLLVFFCLIVVVFICNPCLAFYSRGDINSYLKYENLEVSGWKVSGTLINRTGKRIEVFAKLHFCNSFNESYNSASIHEKLRPNSKVPFSDSLKKKVDKIMKDAHHVEWVIELLTVNGKIAE